MRRLLLAALGLSLGLDARASPVPSYVQDSAGEWLIATDDGKPGCRITFAAKRRGKFWHAVPAAECAARLSAVGRVVAWDYEAGVRLFGSDGTPLLVFGEDETTIMKTGFETPPVHFLVKAPAGVERAPYAPMLTGAWMLRRPGGPALCTLALFKGPKDEETGLTVKTDTPCDPAVARLRLDSARVEDFKLMLYGKPETALGFEPSGPDSYAKSDGGKPLEMIRVR